MDIRFEFRLLQKVYSVACIRPKISSLFRSIHTIQERFKEIEESVKMKEFHRPDISAEGDCCHVLCTA